jgi:hypothetical protein
MELKPGMRVKVEYETTLEGYSAGEDVWVRGVRLNRNGGLSERAVNRPTNVVVTPLPNTVEVTVQLNAPGLSTEEAERIVRRLIESDFSVRDLHQVTFDLKVD